MLRIVAPITDTRQCFAFGSCRLQPVQRPRLGLTP
jgi:hypothetical protein